MLDKIEALREILEKRDVETKDAAFDPGEACIVPIDAATFEIMRDTLRAKVVRLDNETTQFIFDDCIVFETICEDKTVSHSVSPRKENWILKPQQTGEKKERG